MTVLTAIALLMSALSVSAQECSLFDGLSCVNLKGDIRRLMDVLNKKPKSELLAVETV
jgi:hypothetical protein